VSTIPGIKRILPAILLAASSAALAESGSYRVEVIVFRNLTASTEITAAPELRSFSQFPDLQDQGMPQEPVEESREGPAGEQEAGLAAEPAGIMHGDLPDELGVVTDKSAAMDSVWRRLRGSPNYRPLLYAGWEQNRVDYYPPVRVHDLQVLDTQLRPPTHVVVADLAAPDPLAAYRSVFYQLDGSLQLKRSRFLHLFLDLEMREPMQATANGTPVLEQNGLAPATDGAAGDYGIYTLTQNRQINTGEMQYFDTPYFGALVYVTAEP